MYLFVIVLFFNKISNKNKKSLMLLLGVSKISHITLILVYKILKLKFTDGTEKKVSFNLNMRPKLKEFLWF